MGKTGIIVLSIIALLAVTGIYIYRSGNGIQIKEANSIPLSKKSIPSKSIQAGKESVQPSPVISEPVLKEHIEAQNNISAYRIISEEKDVNSKTVSEFQKKGENVNKSVIKYSRSKEQSALIILDGVAYVKDYADNSWWKQKVSGSEDSLSEETKDMLAKVSGTSRDSYTFLREESCGNQTCLLYEETIESGGSRYFIFNKETSLLQEEQFGTEPFTTVNTYEYNDISITAPKKTKDVPAGKSIFDYYTPAGRFGF